MRRQIAVGWLALALAGCAQSRSSMPGTASRAQPIGMDPVPAVADVINRGTGDPAIVRSTLPDPANPKWSGEYKAATGATAKTPPQAPATVARADQSQGIAPGTFPAGLAAPASSPVLASPSSPPLASTTGMLAGPGVPAGAGAEAPVPEGKLAAGAADPSLQPPPAPALQPVPGQQAQGAELLSGPSPDAAPARAGEAAIGANPDPALPPVEESKAVGTPPATAAQGGDTLNTEIQSPPQAAPPATTAPPPGAKPAPSAAGAPATVGDPLLGPNPDLMPAIGPAPAPAPAANDKAAQQPALAKTPTAAAAPSGGTGAGGELPLETAPAAPLNPEPARGSLEPPVALPSAPPADNGQASEPSASATSARQTTSTRTVAATPSPRSDPSLRLASFNPNKLTEMAISRNWKEAGRAAGRVNDEVITLHDLVLTIRAQLIHRNLGRSLSKEESNMLAKNTLAHLIERTLINQEAKRVLKNPKQLDALYEAADKYWREEEMPPLMRHYMADNEHQLKQKLNEAGIPMDFLRQSHRQEFLAMVYRDKKLSDFRKVDLPEMLRYYNDHYRDREYDRPAQITWREVVVEKEKHPAPAEARRKAESLLVKLQQGENFAALARKESEGPSSIRAQGGLMQTSPGSYAVEAVNQALDTLPINRVSPILEGPTSYHIVVVENRRAAGPASFKELQDEMRSKVMYQKMRKANDAFMAKLRRDALISTIFDGTESDPNSVEKE